MPGKAGTQKAHVHEIFTKRLRELRQNALSQADGFRGSELRSWQVPEDTGDLLDVPNLHKPAFDRTEINDNYLECMQSAEDFGTTGDVISLKNQLDYNATEERAFRLRHASLVRCMTNAMGRRHGQSVSRIFTNIEKQAADAIANGGAGGLSGDSVLGNAGAGGEGIV